MPRELTDITVTLIHRTEEPNGDPKAYLLHDGTTQAWVPASACELDLNPDGKSYTATLPVRLAEEKGFTNG